MTPQSGKSAGESGKPEKKSDAVRTDTDSATGRETTTVVDEAIDQLGGDPTDMTEEHASDSSTVSTNTASSDLEGCQDVKAGRPEKTKRSGNFARLLAHGVLPGLALLLAAAAGYLRWQEGSIHASQIGSVESVAAARDGTIAILSYQPDTVEKDLGAARERLTGTFKESYTQLTNDVVIPGAKQRHISAVATVPAAASVSATGSHAVALVFVNQTVVVGTDAPSATASSVRVTLDKVGGRWLISGFDPV